ncbi:MAG: hypothetical protein NUV96_02295 [Candidatus Colwellbacteria bacterium]|nr:hypothetical protein [Candidatus Colwellbacteria bacterium]
MNHQSELYFEDPLLKLGMGTRLWVKSLKSIFNIVSFVAGLVMIFSDVTQVFYLGILLLAIFLYNSLLAKLLSRRGQFRGGNLKFFMDMGVEELLERAINRSTIMGGSFLLHLMRELVDTPDGVDALRRLSIEKDEFVGQVERYVSDEKRLRETNSWKLKRAEELMIKALTTQMGNKRPISCADLFRAMVYMDNEKIQRLFNIFGITESVMENSYRYSLEHAR